MRTGLLAAVVAAVPAKLVLGQSWKDRDGNPGDDPVAQNDPLGNYTKATFQSYLNSVFQLQTMIGVVGVTLSRIDDMPSPKGGECFSLLFRGGGYAFGQDTYALVHPSLGTFQLFLVPVGTDQNGAQGYLATINRLSFSDAANSIAPTKRSGSIPPTWSPAITQPATPSNPAPKSKRRPNVKRKPSWKIEDNEDFETEINDWL